MPQMVMNGLARYHAGTAARPPTAEHKFTMFSPWRLSDHQWPRSLCWASYALVRNRETVAIDALGEGDMLILRGASATLIAADLFQIYFAPICYPPESACIRALP